MEQLNDNLLFRWFVGLAMDAPVWDATVFTKNRDRLLGGDVAAKFLAAVAQLEVAGADRRRRTLGADKGYDVQDFIAALRARQVTPHIARNDHVTKTGKRRTSAVDGRTTRHPSYAVSLRRRKRIEEIFGWMFALTTSAYNLTRLPKLMAATRARPESASKPADLGKTAGKAAPIPPLNPAFRPAQQERRCKQRFFRSLLAVNDFYMRQR